MLRTTALVALAPLIVACSTAPGSTSSSAASSSSTSTSSSTSSSNPGPCAASAVDGIDVIASDPLGGVPFTLGYPPYAIDGCTVVYVAPNGALHRRALATGDDVVLAPPSDVPRRPVVAGDVIAWEATGGGKSVVVIDHAGVRLEVAGDFDHASEPRATLDAVVFTAWKSADPLGDADIALVDITTGTTQVIGSGPAQQRFADVDADHVAYSDFAEDPDGRFDDNETDVADIVIVDRKTLAHTTRSRTGKQAFALLGVGGKLGYLDWGLVHPEPKFHEFDFYEGDLTSDATNDQQVAHVISLSPYVRPTARGTLFEWVDAPDLKQTLLRRGADLTMPAQSVAVGAQDGFLYGPATTDHLTIYGELSGSGVLKLRAVDRP
jgi:hypothetical protein